MRNLEKLSQQVEPAGDADQRPREQAKQIDDADLLLGAAAIAGYLRGKGMPVDNHDIYYLAKQQTLAIGRLGKNLIASKRRLSRDLQRAAQALPS